MDSDKILRFINYSYIVLLTLVLLVSVVQTRHSFNRYGASYTVTTIIGSDVAERTVTVYESLAAIALIFVLLVVLMINTLNLRVGDTDA